MEFSVPQLFNYFLTAESPDPIDIQQLLQVLRLTTSTQLEELQIALDGLVRLGFLERTREGDRPLYAKGANGTLVEGRLRCYNKQNKVFGFATRKQSNEEDIYIHPDNLNGAWNGDRVLARVTRYAQRQRSPEGEVAAVIERANPTLVARLKQTETGLKAIPLDDRFLLELDLIVPPGGAALSWSDGQVVYIEVVRYPLASTTLPAQGKLLKVLSNSIDLVFCKYNLPQTFAPEVVKAAQSLPEKLSKTEIKKRQDYRNWLTVTIEALDIQHPHSPEPDIAVSLAALPQGSPGSAQWQLGIHIADVAHWIEADHPLDQEAYQRGSAVYLDTEVLPLFPPVVRNRCALLPQQDRLTLSIVLQLAADGSVCSYEIHPSVINSSAHLTYGQVQALLATASGSTPTPESPSDLLSLLLNLQQVSQVLRQERHSKGGFELQVPDLMNPVSADEDGSGTLVIAASLPVHAMMSEFLLLANRCIGQHFEQLGLPALRRVQAAPTVDTFQSFLRLSTNLNLDLNPADPLTVTPADFQRFCRRISESDVVALGATPALTNQLLATLPAPVYQVVPRVFSATDEEPSSSEPATGSAGESDPTDPSGDSTPAPELYFGLGLPTAFCHATSPLRRYADVLNQRILHLLFSKGRDKSAPRSKTRVNLNSSTAHGQVDWNVLPPRVQEETLEVLHAKVASLNERQWLARQAEQELDGLKKSEFMQSHLGETFPGLIVRVQNYGFFVLLDAIQAEGLVHVDSLNDDWYEFRNRQQALVGRKSRRQFRLGDRVEVQIKNVDYYRQQSDLVVVGEGRPYEEEEVSPKLD